MEVIVPSRTLHRPAIGPVVAGTIVGTLLVVFGVVLAVIAFATPVLSWVMPAGRPGATEFAFGMAVWAFALVAPAGFVLLGTTRLTRLLGAARRRMPRRTPLQAALGTLPPGVVLASGLRLPDGRNVSDVLIGPFGAAILRELPPAGATRIREGHWELRGSRRWIPLENPLERASRDAERVRRWLGHDDADFVVKTYAAVIAPSAEAAVPRTAACAVLTPDQVPAWIEGLPAQRSLTPGRIARILDMAREAAG